MSNELIRNGNIMTSKIGHTFDQGKLMQNRFFYEAQQFKVFNARYSQ